MIAGQVLGLTAFLAVMWGVYFVASLREYLQVRQGRQLVVVTRRQEIVRAFRRVVVAFCLFSLPLSAAVRSLSVVLGFGPDVGAGVVYFMLVAPNVVGAIFCVASLRYD